MRTYHSIIRWAVLCSLAALPLQLTAASLGTAFSYQGRLSDINGPVTGLYDFTFALWDASTLGNQLGTTFINSATALGVTNGLFTTSLDFGTCILSDQVCWLEITVCTNLDQAHKHTLPRQQLMPAPQSLYAQKAGTAADGAVSVTALNTSGAPIAGQVLTYDGSQLAWTTPSGGGPGAWGLSGNKDTTSANFVGTTDNQPLELRVNNLRAMRLEPASSPNMIVNPSANSVANDGSAYGSSIGGGSQNQVQQSAVYSVIGGGEQNQVEPNADHSVVAGGYRNSAGARGAAVGGGEHNVASGIGAVVAGGGVDGTHWPVPPGSGNTANAAASTVGGGVGNIASASYATVAGGILNAATYTNATVGGGGYNTAGWTSSTVAGGYRNTADGSASAIPGGYNNRASGAYSFAAGLQAQALHDGCFVWADSQGGPLASTANDQFLIRAANGVRVQSDVGIHLNGVDRPMIVRDWDVFPAAAPNGKAGVGRWGLFMEPRSLTLGIPGDDVPGRNFQVAKYSQDGTAHALVTVSQDGNLACKTLTILGGADLAEPFIMSEPAIEAGSVVVIDEHNPGRLKLSRHAYDRKVAGVLSGAGGVHPGISMVQEDALGGGHNVALSGRVYALAEAENGSIQPGDLLTTSNVPGHAMRVSDYTKAQGTILGKAMSSLETGRGLVLTLVTLQ